MKTELTNLLPEHRKRKLAHGYLFRVFVVASLLVTLLVVAHALLLIPTYLYVAGQASAEEKRLATLQIPALDSLEKEIEARIRALEGNENRLIQQSDRPTAARAIGAVLVPPRTGIRITGFTFSPSTTAELTKMTLTGRAVNREALRTYVQTLDDLIFVEKAELPISAYAKERDIEFIVTLTGSFKP